MQTAWDIIKVLLTLAAVWLLIGAIGTVLCAAALDTWAWLRRKDCGTYRNHHFHFESEKPYTKGVCLKRHYGLYKCCRCDYYRRRARYLRVHEGEAYVSHVWIAGHDRGRDPR